MTGFQRYSDITGKGHVRKFYSVLIRAFLSKEHERLNRTDRQEMTAG